MSAVPERSAADAVPAIRLVCWGTRGSLPSPGPHTVRFGGNTPCVEVRTGDGRLVILDGGTGIVGLGRLLDREGLHEIDLFLTHFHLDHIQGLPFFAPFYDPEVRIRIHGEPQQGIDIRTLLTTLMGSPYFPVPLREAPAHIEFHHLDGRSSYLGDVTVTPFRVQHPEYTSGFRIACGSAVVVYIPDNEPEGVAYPVPASWQADLLEFVHGADLLIHDAMFTNAEYAHRRGWGHATFEQAVRLAEAAGVRRLLLFHHSPERADDELDAIVRSVQRDVTSRGGTLQVDAAVEGQEIRVGAMPRPVV